MSSTGLRVEMRDGEDESFPHWAHTLRAEDDAYVTDDSSEASYDEGAPLEDPFADWVQCPIFAHRKHPNLASCNCAQDL